MADKNPQGLPETANPGGLHYKRLAETAEIINGGTGAYR